MADKCIDAYLFASVDLGADWVEKGIIASPEKTYEVMEVSSPFYALEKDAAKIKTGADGDSVFLWVGRLNANKDPLNVVRAFLNYVDIKPSARLYMVYHTDELLAEIRAVLKNNKNRNAVILVGRVEHADLLYWFNSADFIISGSHYEGGGTAVCEAISCGCIPVITNIPSFRMMTDNGNIGILYEPGNEAALLAALIQTQQMNKQQQRDRALAYFKSNLSFEAIANRIHEIAASL